MGQSKTDGRMGFRDLICFNKALLAKQGWCLIQYPNSLVVTIIKAKYYPKGMLLEVKVGHRPSLAWRSIISAVDLLEEGLIWRIGDGRSVHICGDWWLPIPSTYKIQSLCPVEERNALVSSLIDHNTSSWNIQKISYTFDKTKDDIVWRPTQSGEFFVRSAYFLEMERKQRDQGAGSTPSRQSDVWKIVWKLKVSNLTKVFLWQACSDILPTRVDLRKRGVLDDDLCMLCKMEPKTVIHALWECSAS
jgi:hypothetical protein